MKKIVCMVLCVFMLLSFIGCSMAETNSANANFEQQMTIVTMPSPPKWKTTSDATKINKVMNVLSEIERIKVLMQEALDLEQLVVFSSKSKELTFTDKVEPIAPVSNNYGKIKVEDLQNKGVDVISAIVALRDEKVDMMNKAINDFKNIKTHPQIDYETRKELEKMGETEDYPRR